VLHILDLEWETRTCLLQELYKATEGITVDEEGWNGNWRGTETEKSQGKYLKTNYTIIRFMSQQKQILNITLLRFVGRRERKFQSVRSLVIGLK
jgi:hypothetical protein